MYSISIIIPNYNGAHLLQKTINCAYTALQTSNIQNYELIIADDASTDNSVLFIKQHYPQVILIENKQNKGFASNTNSAIAQATKNLILILNSDVYLQPNYFTTLLPYFNNPTTFGVMGKITNDTQTKVQDTAKYPAYTFANIVATKNYETTDNISLYSFYLSGANALVCRKKLQILQGFNAIFDPYYSEDVDLGIKAWRCNYKLYYEPTAVCVHLNSDTIKKQPSNKVKIIAKRNKFFLHYLHLNGVELYYFILKIIIKTFFRTLIFDTNYTKSAIQFFTNFNNLKKNKQEFKKNCEQNNITPIKTLKQVTQEIKKTTKLLKIRIF